MKNVISILLTFLLFSCVQNKEKIVPVNPEAFQSIYKGKETALYTLRNANGMTVELSNYGARIVSIWVPDQVGNFKDVVWGHASIKDYIDTPVRYANPIIGRVANRIGNGQFVLDGERYQLSINSNGNHLHGGSESFEAQVWEVEVLKEGCSLEMSYLSPDGQDGYPGNLLMKVVYTLGDDNRLTLTYSATTDAPTIVNPTTHVMFNLSGSTKNDILQHQVIIAADSILVMNEQGIPTGKLLNVKDTPLDFTQRTAIGDRIDSNFTLLQQAKGYDHYYIFNKQANDPKAAVFCPSTGIKLEVFTDQLGMQLYTGNYFGGTVKGKRDNMNNHRSIVALECQNYPDAINHGNFPSIILRPNETYYQITSYAFSVISQ